MVVLQNVSPPSEGVRHEQAEITAVLDGKGLGPGTLCVAETRVSWFDGSGVGFSLEYPSISLHAISRDLSAYPEEHLYVMVNCRCKGSKDEEEKGDSDDDVSGDDYDDNSDYGEDSADVVTEIRFVPSDKGSLETMFAAMSQCQALHPDPDDSDSDFDGDEYDVEEAEQGQIDLPTYYSFEKGMSQLTVEDQAMTDGMEGMVTPPPAPVHRMEDAADTINDELKTNPGTRTVSGQFDDADIDHCT
ncbi:methylosome subunit pICln-like isoform X2 [Brachyhypopomus gauderio]|uniref:methylosome subunit pICln-like isoform X2 n=1 Tax=Brachyhypopomus gauderio TaxID=698409 RepID=UPI00404325A8